MSVTEEHIMPVGCAIVAERIGSEQWKKIEELERVMETMPQQECPLRHIFTPGLYCRTIFMPAGTKLTSRIHLYEHPFVISSGKVRVCDDDNGWVIFTAPHIGVTKPGTRRIIEILEDCIWSTFHVTDETDPDKIVLQVTYSEGKFSELGGSKSRCTQSIAE